MLAAAGCASMLIEVPPFRLSGTVYGTLLNHHSALAALAEVMDLPPYKGAPQAPVLYVKPRNTLAHSGDPVTVPNEINELQVGACLGVVIGRSACKLRLSQVFEHVAGYLIVNDISVPHATYYRPSIRLKARDGFCPLGAVTARAQVPHPDALQVRTYVDGLLVQTTSTADLVRSVEQLLVAVTEFMTLAPGDVVAMGVAAAAPRVRAGQQVSIEIDGLQTLSNCFVGAAL